MSERLGKVDQLIIGIGIIYNMITQTLAGTMRYEKMETHGACFVIDLPRSI